MAYVKIKMPLVKKYIYINKKIMLKDVFNTLAQASFVRTASLFGSTCRANFRLLMVYSWPQYTRWTKQKCERLEDSKMQI